MGQLKLIIFDLDGTLTDSLADLTDAVNQMLLRFGRSRLTQQEVRKLVGEGARRLVEKALPGAAAAEIEEALGIFLAYNEQHIADRTVLYPGVRETLPLLVRAGRSLAVVSNKNEALCRKLLDTLGIGHHFAAVLGADSLPERKPSPLPLLHLMERFGAGPGETAIIGDSRNDILAGQGAGIIVVGCRYGYGEEAELTAADFRIAAFAELPSLPPFGSPP
jgi:phosphoglycolate phosphatase